MESDRELAKVARLYDALKRIARYQTPEQLERGSQRQYGLSYHEALEMAYANVLEEAKQATKGMRRPVRAAQENESGK